MPTPKPQCSSYWKGNLWVTVNNSRQLYLTDFNRVLTHLGLFHTKTLYVYNYIFDNMLAPLRIVLLVFSDVSGSFSFYKKVFNSAMYLICYTLRLLFLIEYKGVYKSNALSGYSDVFLSGFSVCWSTFL